MEFLSIQAGVPQAQSITKSVHWERSQNNIDGCPSSILMDTRQLKEYLSHEYS
jgi:hypothetical protein